MRVALCLLFCASALGLALADPPADKNYSAKYDNVDVDRILNNGRILTNYIKCMMDEGPCTQDGRELKKTLPDALLSGCNKCNEKQKLMSEKVINHLIKHRKKDWDRLTKKYDPKGEYEKKYQEAVNAKNGGVAAVGSAASSLPTVATTPTSTSGTV